MFLFIVWAVSSDRKLLKLHLQEEYSLGLISAKQYHTATSAWAQSFARLTALTSGRYKATKRFYRVCGELAHKKHQYLKLGNEKNNVEIIQQYRAELDVLRDQAMA